MDAFCRRSAEGKLAAGGRARCSLTTHERLRIHGSPSYSDQPTNCSAFYLAAVGAGSVLQFHAMAQPAPQHMVSSAIAPAADWTNTSAASRWASKLRWRTATAFAPDALGRLHGLCLVHLQGPRTKEMFMEALTTPARARARQNRTEQNRNLLEKRHKRQDQARFGPGVGVPRHGISRQQTAAAAGYAGDEVRHKKGAHHRGEAAPDKSRL